MTMKSLALLAAIITISVYIDS